MSNINDRAEVARRRLTGLYRRRDDAALAVVGGEAGSAELLEFLKGEIAEVEGELATLRAAAGAAVRREESAAAAAAAEARAAACKRLAGLAKERTKLLRELYEAIQAFEAALDKVLATESPIAADLRAIGQSASASAILAGEFEHRLSKLIRKRLSHHVALGLRRVGTPAAPEDFANWLAVEERLLEAQVSKPASAG